MKTLVMVLFLCLIIGCQSSNKNYVKVKTPKVPARTHDAPKNITLMALTNWEAYSQRIDKESKLYKKYSASFEKKEKSASIKKRIVVTSLSEKQKKIEDEIKMALHCSGKFVVVEPGQKDWEKDLENPESTKLAELAKSLYVQYALVLRDKKVAVYDLNKGTVLREDMFDNNILGITKEISAKVEGEKLQCFAEPVVMENKSKVVVNLGKLDGVKAGDKLKVKIEEQEEEEELLIEEVEDKYATAITSKKIKKKVTITKF